uniref:Uncharacterized protein n=1 Tax=Pyxicephalus adspersus TaxID=30357 RepID=A0AAV3B5I8_PYXAD|nr:TPA: hypothetical protein GDO54_006335 [Pyxicephalus adspersus]
MFFLVKEDLSELLLFVTNFYSLFCRLNITLGWMAAMRLLVNNCSDRFALKEIVHRARNQLFYISWTACWLQYSIRLSPYVVQVSSVAASMRGMSPMYCLLINSI